MNTLTLVASPAELEIVTAILLRHVPQYEVWAFGSRVKGTSKPFADLDLAILGDQPIPLGILAALNDDFIESDLPYKVDLVDWASTSDTFRSRIASAHLVIQPPGTAPISPAPSSAQTPPASSRS